jgi:hypothetical protein
MTHAIISALLVAALSASLSIAAPAAHTSSAAEQAESARSAATVPNHSLTGVVKSVDATTLVITRAGKSPGEMTFVLTPATHRDGPIVVGAAIQVRFRVEGRTQIATALRAAPAKPRADQQSHGPDRGPSYLRKIRL